MNNDLEQFSEERLQRYINQFAEDGMCDITDDEIMPLIRIAIAAKQAKPIGFVGKSYAMTYFMPPQDCGVEIDDLIYTTQQPAHTERDGWKLVPIEPTQEMVDAHMSGMQSAGFSRAYRDMLAAAPKPESE